MTTTLKIVHTTGYTYSDTVNDSFNEIRMSPNYSPQQLIRERTVTITPHPWSADRIDYWGTQVTAFEIHEPHRELTVQVTTVLDVTREVQERRDFTLADERGETDRWNEYLAHSPATEPGDDMRARAEDIARGKTSVDEIGLAIGHLIHEEMTYEFGFTDINSLAADSWDAKKGVCQDFAHLQIGALRHLGIPARYVSGYILPKADAKIGEPVVGESHAWVEWWNGTWFAFDPTNNAEPGEMHVTVGTGRDYFDITPLRGMFTGVAGSEMFVEVEMTRLT